jgi:ferric-dicitrate binding protein FerR (iron transport regulator)
MEVDFQVIKRYLDGKEQDGDKEKILSWFSDSRTEGNLRREYHRYWEELTNHLNMEGYDPDKVLGRIYHEIKLEESKSLLKKKRFQRIIGTVTKVAAVLFIPLMIYTLINNNIFPKEANDTTYAEIYSPPGTRTMFYLPDGSSGCLNSGSHLKFPTEFKGKSREVELEGEAYFDVRSNPQKPFIVAGTSIKVVAYGTSFNVMTFPDDEINQVTLVKGKVKVLEKRNGQIQDLGILEPDQMCIYDRSSSSCRFIPVDAKRMIAWKDGKLIFRDEPFEEVVKKLNRRYNSNLIIKDEKLKTYKYLATFEDETLDEIVKLLRISAPIEIKELARMKNQDGTFNKRTIELYYRPKN